MMKQVYISRMVKKYKIDLPQYGGNQIELILGPTLKECITSHKILKSAEGLDQVGGEGMTVRITNGNKAGVGIILATQARDIERSIVHECFHATITLADFFGLKCDSEESEAGAYLMDYLYSEVRERYLKYVDLLEKKEDK